VPEGAIDGMISPGTVDAKAVRKKLSKQLLIDLEPEECVHLSGEPITSSTKLSTTRQDQDRQIDAASPDTTVVASADDIDDDDDEELMLLKQLFRDVDVSKPCSVQIRQLGEYMARLSLKGGHIVPLRVEVLKR